MPLLKPVLMFDFDGTLINSVPDLAAATNAMMQQLGREPYPLSTIEGWIGNGSRMLVARALSGERIVSDALSCQEIDDAEAIFLEAYAAHDVSHTTPYPDVDAGLAQLKETGYTLALVTNKPIRFVPRILEALGWQDHFSVVMGGDSLPQKKPDPAPLHHVCETLQISADKALMIGDSINDILAGQRAGVDTVGVTYGYNYGQPISESQPTYVFDSFAKLTAWLLSDDLIL